MVRKGGEIFGVSRGVERRGICRRSKTKVGGEKKSALLFRASSPERGKRGWSPLFENRSTNQKNGEGATGGD